MKDELQLKEIRCTKEVKGRTCNSLLAKADYGVFEIKCPRCNNLVMTKIIKASTLTKQAF